MENKNFTTPDLWLAAFLLLDEAKLKGIKQDPRREYRYMVILEGKDLEEKQREYYKNGQVSAISYKNMVLNLKHLIFEEKKKNMKKEEEND